MMKLAALPADERGAAAYRLMAGDPAYRGTAAEASRLRLELLLAVVWPHDAPSRPMSAAEVESAEAGLLRLGEHQRLQALSDLERASMLGESHQSVEGEVAR